jgi:hypothetical protein
VQKWRRVTDPVRNFSAALASDGGLLVTLYCVTDRHPSRSPLFTIRAM